MKPLNVLIAPLDWGLGHASRTVPLIQEFLKNNVKVFLACSGVVSDFFAKEFPELEQLNIPSYRISYPDKAYKMPLWAFLQALKLKRVVKAEQKCIENIVSQKNIDIVISDNRFGAYSKKAYSVYITHQLRILFPKYLKYLEFIGICFHKKQMKNFSEIWVPDFKERNGLAGRLSHLKKMFPDIYYIEPLSRFQNKEIKPKAEKHFKYLAVVSGVEPTRSVFETRIRNVLKQMPGKSALLCGKPGVLHQEKDGNLTVFSHLKTEAFQELVLDSEFFISRSGYSTIMDQMFLKSNCLFIPTPGQTEQEYLAEFLDKEKQAFCLKENQLSRKNVEKVLKNPPRKIAGSLNSELEKTVQRIIQKSKEGFYA